MILVKITHEECDRQLNELTVKDKFPRPITKELLDEFYGIMVFTMLDLRSRYHWIRVCLNDTYKTAFQT